MGFLLDHYPQVPFNAPGTATPSVFFSTFDLSFMPPMGGPTNVVPFVNAVNFWFSSAENALFGNPIIGAVKARPMEEIYGTPMLLSTNAGTNGNALPVMLPIRIGPQVGLVAIEQGGASIL